MKVRFAYILMLLISSLLYSLVQGQSQTLIVKVKPKYTHKCNKSNIDLAVFNSLKSDNVITSTEKMFPRHSPIKQKNGETKKVDLSTIYKVTVDNEKQVEKTISLLNKNDHIEYVEREVINELIYTPSDTQNYKQWYLHTVRAYDAWDVEKGDTNVVIAITDTGIDTTHADLLPDLAINRNDPRNGVDDDGDGYIDNYFGWNTGSNNNNVHAHNSGHGANVAGIAAATTDNVLGISGCGFNSRLLTVKIDNASGQLSGAYEGIVYAADQGAFIINTSWGSYSYSQLAQDIVNYATINKGSMIIAGAGNGPFTGPLAGIGVEDEFYPAAYDNVIAVGSTLEGDTVKESSNYGYWLDIFAPGENMYTTNSAGGYGINGGTSMAAPVVAGAAALVKAHFPSYNGKQVMHQLKNTADNISAINQPKYQGKLGSGRVNFFRALTETGLPGISFENVQITDGNDDSFTAGDTLKISGQFRNYLATANSITVNVQSIGVSLQPIDASTFISQINSLDSADNKQDPFLFLIPSGLNNNVKAELLVTISTSNYSNREYLRFNINNDYITVEENQLRLTLTSEGGIGYSGSNSNLGEGIIFKRGNSLLFEGGFAIGLSSNDVVNKFRGTSGSDNDFSIRQLIRKETPITAAAEYSSSFREKNNTRLDIIQRNYLYNSPKRNQSAIYSYNIKNVSGSTLSNLYAGIFMDWDIVNYSNNKVSYDLSRKMGVSYSTDSNLFCGIKVLTTNLNANHYALDNISQGGGGVDPTGGFTDAEKYQVLSTSRNSAGQGSASGNDIMDAISLGPKTLAPDSNFTASFAVIIANTTAELEEEADSLQNMFNRIISGIDLRNESPLVNTNTIIYPNPGNGTLNIEFYLNGQENVSFKVFDTSGRLVFEEPSKSYASKRHFKQLNLESLKTGVYFLNIIGESFKIQNKFVVSP